MTDSPQPYWPRPNWHASKERARLVYFVFGDFTGMRLPDWPAGIGAKVHDHKALKRWEGYPLAGSLGEVLADEASDLVKNAGYTAQVMRVAGELKDPSDLDYLRDTLRGIGTLLDQGASAVVDPQTSGIFDRHRWLRDMVSGNGKTLRQHFLVVLENDPAMEHHYWVHTRGLRKFARPDVSLTGVPESQTNRAGVLVQQLADMQALGGHFAEGQAFPVDEVGILTAHLAGSEDDPLFYNTHVSLRWP